MHLPRLARAPLAALILGFTAVHAAWAQGAALAEPATNPAIHLPAASAPTPAPAPAAAAPEASAPRVPVAPSASAAVPAPAAAPAAAPSLALYAVEIKVGAKWDPVKPAYEQLHFREHSANLRRLREQGHLVIGARYGDKGLLVLQAATEQAVHALLNEDPSIRAQVFAYELHPFHVFYGGQVQPPGK